MAGKVLTGAAAYYGEHDISAIGMSFEPSMNLEIPEARVFSSGYVQKEAGLRNDTATFNALLEWDVSTGMPGEDLFGNIGTRVPFSVHLGGATVAELDPSMFLNAISGTQSAPATQGDLLQIQLELGADGPIVFGKVLAHGQKTSTGTSVAGWQAGAVADGQSIFAVLHVPSADSGTIDVVIESDDNAGFTSATTRLTFTQVGTTATYEFVSDKPTGGITDDYWRASWTSAATPDHTISVSFGIA